jgi:hypothetical protein
MSLTVKRQNRFREFGLKILFPLVMAGLAIAAFQKPYYNWDMLGYMAAAVSMEISNPDSVHAIVYASAAAELPAKNFSELIDHENEYRSKNFNDAGYFHEQQVLYVIKPLYVLLVYVFYKSGFTLTASTVLPSVLSYFFMGLLLFSWLLKTRNPWQASCFSLLLMISPPFWAIAQYSSPDALCDLLIFAGFYFLIESNKPITGWFVLVLSVATRIDAIILVLMTLVFLKFAPIKSRSVSWPFFIINLSVSCVLFLAIAILLGHFNTGFIKYYALIPSDFAREVSSSPVQNYFILLVKGIYDSRFAAFPLFVLSALITIIIRRRTHLLTSDFEAGIILLLLLNMLVRYLLHPLIEDRFFAAHYLLITIIYIKTIFGTMREPAISKHG